MNSTIKNRPENIKSIEMELKDLSIHMVKLLKEYKDKGIIDEEQFNQHIKLKLEFLNYLKNKEEN